MLFRKRCCWGMILGMWALVLRVQAATHPYWAAGCVLHVNNKILLVQDGRAQKWALPAGYIQYGETPEQAALRETYEEIGVRVRVQQALVIHQADVQLFACQAIHPLQLSDQRLNILTAPHLGRESTQAGVFSEADLPTLNLRFPEQIQRIMPLLVNISASPSQQVTNFGAASLGLQASELTWVERFVAVTRTWGKVFWLGNVFSGSWFYGLALVLVAWLFGWAYLHRMTLGLMGIAAVVQTLKPMLGWPRPFHYLPYLNLEGAPGYGMPSAHVCSVFFFFGALAMWCKERMTLMLSLPLALAVALYVAASRVSLGVHFISDVLVGLILAGVFLLLERYLARWEQANGQLWVSRSGVWGGVSLLCLGSALFFGQESLLMPCALTLGYSVMCCVGRLSHGRVAAGQAVWLGGGMILLILLQRFLLEELVVFWQQAIGIFFLSLLLGYWLSWGASTSFPGGYKQKYSR